MVTARSAAMAFNRLADREIDARNPRTAGRHLPAGLVSARTVIWFTIANCVGFVAATLCFLPNVWPLILSVPVLAWLLGYSYAKRFSEFAHFWLGFALGFAPVAAWIALRAELAWPPVLLGIAVLFWVAGFDILYACQDAEFDMKEGLRSIPAWLGIKRSLTVAAVCHVMTVICLGLLGWFASPPLGVVYGVGVAAAAILLVYEHAIVSSTDLSRVNRAFFHVNAVISLGLLSVCLLDVAWV
jgi:4-hydroxybenzoate polyprenyltransferase